MDNYYTVKMIWHVQTALGQRAPDGKAWSRAKVPQLSAGINYLSPPITILRCYQNVTSKIGSKSQSSGCYAGFHFNRMHLIFESFHWIN